MQAKVSIVGAGPGDPDLLTIKALKAIQTADAVVYDRLVSDEIVALIPRGVVRIYAGKSCKQKAMPQEEINQLLVTLAKKGGHVVRLKGGDPFMFGRGGEEALELIKHQIPFEIIPGITSAQGCGAYAGIPLTHRGLATGVRYLTGHRQYIPSSSGLTGGSHADGDPLLKAKDDELDLNWASLADPDTTLVIYMGLANLAVIAEKLIEHGLPANTPAAAIEQGTTSKQRVISADLKTISNVVQQAQLEPPTLAIIGKVAALAKDLAWFAPQEDGNTDNYQIPVTKLSY